MVLSKAYCMEVRSDSDYADIPTLAKFSIDAATAREIIHLAGLVKAHGLYKVEKFDYRVTYLMHDPDQDPESAAAAGEDNDVRTEADVMNVCDTDFWFSAYIKHTDVEIVTERQRIDELATHFGIPR